MTRRERKRILIADDSGTVRHLLKLILKKHIRCDITEVRDGAEAARSLSERSYDLIITDVNMPHLNGLGLVRKVRTELFLEVPIIIVTTIGGEADRDEGLKQGADSYITKPINGQNLVSEAVKLMARGSHPL